MTGPSDEGSPSGRAGGRRSRGGLPDPLTPLIGRDGEVRELLAMLAGDDVRCVTLTGPGGVGKTRVALAAIDELSARAAGDVWFVPLAAVRSADGVAPAIGRAIGLRQPGRRSSLATLVRRLSDRQAVLVLDNFERVGAAAPMVASLLGQCPGLRVLATSRVPLGLYGEAHVEIGPLAVPETGDVHGRDADAVRLFADRAHAASSRFALTDDLLPTVAAICRRLDGLPLAIELAASWVGVLPPEAILARLGQRRLRLGDGPVDQPERLRALDDAVSWSHDLLDPDQQRLFRRLAVFAGGFTLAAAERVAAGWEGDPAGGPQVLERLKALVRKSLVRLAAGSAPDAPRYELLETIRDFALARLEAAGEAEEGARRHAAWCVGLVDEARATLGAPTQEMALRQIETEHDNLREALRWAIDRGDPIGLRLAGELWRFWYSRGYLAEGRRWLEDAAAMPGDASPASRSGVLLGLGVMAQARGDTERAVDLLSDALTRFREFGDAAGIATSLNFLGLAMRDAGDLQRAVALHREALALTRSTGDPWRLCMSLNLLAAMLGRTGQGAEAHALLGESLAVARARGDRWSAAAAWTARGDLDRQAGRAEDAAEAYSAALAVYKELGHPQGEAQLLTRLADIDGQRGDLKVARTRLELAARLAGTADDGRGRATALLGLGPVLRKQGDLPGSLAAVAAGVSLASELGDRELVLDGLGRAAEAARANGDLRLAARLAAAQSAAGQHAAPADAAPSIEEAVQLIQALGRSETPPVAAGAARPSASGGDRYSLSPRELDVLTLMADGRTDRAIADALFISHRTVATHVANILGKLGTETRTGAATFAVRHGMV